MIRPIVTDPLFLSRPSEPATQEDLDVARDLLDTLCAHLDHCLGMAANMIGVHKRIIAVSLNGFPIAMLDPVVTHRSGGTYEAEEGCLSLSGTRKAVRWQSIQVEFRDMAFRTHRQTYTGLAAQIIQHEIDHCNGVLI